MLRMRDVFKNCFSGLFLMDKYRGYIQEYVDVALVDPPSFPEKKDRSPFAAWNAPELIPLRNCYAFACDALFPDVKDLRALLWANGRQEMGSEKCAYMIPFPGTSGGEAFEAFASKSLRKALIRDGFISLPQIHSKSIRIPRKHYLIAAFLSDRDYHFYRYHAKEGVWYHKLGWDHPVTNRDLSGKVIETPLWSERGPYQAFVGYFLSPPERRPMDIIVEDGAGNVIYRAAPERNLVAVATSCCRIKDSPTRKRETPQALSR